MPTLLRRLPFAVTALAVLIAATGCGAGLDAGTSREFTVINGLNAQVGSVQVRNGRVVPVSPDRAMVYLQLIEQGAAPDAVTGASSPLASSANLISGGSAPATPGALELRPGQVVVLGEGTAAIELVGLKRPLVAGQAVTVTLVLARTGPLDLSLPVVSAATAAPAPTA